MRQLAKRRNPKERGHTPSADCQVDFSESLCRFSRLRLPIARRSWGETVIAAPLSDVAARPRRNGRHFDGGTWHKVLRFPLPVFLVTGKGERGNLNLATRAQAIVLDLQNAFPATLARRQGEGRKLLGGSGLRGLGFTNLHAGSQREILPFELMPMRREALFRRLDEREVLQQRMRADFCRGASYK